MIRIEEQKSEAQPQDSVVVTAEKVLVAHLDHINLTVTSLAESERWYARVFGFNVVERGTYQGMPWAIIRAGEAMLAMYEAADRRAPSASESKRAQHHRVAHIGLRIRHRAQWEATLARENVVVEQEYRYPHSQSWYVVDPSGWEIEVACWDDDRVRFMGDIFA